MKHLSLFLMTIFLLANTPLFSQNKKTMVNRRPATFRAVVVGIGQYQDTVFAQTRGLGADARRDAEEYAAFLQSMPGGGLERDQILLLTDGNATLARFVAALDWLLDESGQGKRLVYFAGAANIVDPGGKKEDAKLFFHDSPPAPWQGNTFALATIRNLLEKKGGPFTVIASFRMPFSEKIGAALPYPNVWNKTGKSRRSIYLKKNAGPPPTEGHPARKTAPASGPWSHNPALKG